MLFNSIQFLIFFPIVTSAYFILPHRYRWGLLLVASCYFYMAFIPVYILIIFFTIIVDFIAGILIERSPQPKRKVFLGLSLVTNLLVLAIFKYVNFIGANLSVLAHLVGWRYTDFFVDIILPVGLSFHTFQAMSYTIEVYRGKQPAEKHLGIFALYVMFYPQLVAGPIERPQNLLHQFRERHTFDYARVSAGLQLMIIGLFKKIVIADRLALYVDQVYNNPADASSFLVITATYFFAFQIYCDFSAYSDIAIGAAQVMGFKLVDNFRQPYFSRSIGEFWRRWHMSLSNWFRDYVYIPLGGNRYGPWRTYRNIAIVFLLSGLWHGANWTFIIWGTLHALYMIIYTAGTRWTSRVNHTLQGWFRRAAGSSPATSGRIPALLIQSMSILVTFHVVAFAWIFFRADSVHTAFILIQRIFTFGSLSLPPGIGKTTFFGNIIWIVVLLGIDFVDIRYGLRAELARRPTWFRWMMYQALIIAMVIFGIHARSAFIYFQF